MKKLAIIRSNKNTKCSFCLSIPDGCKNAGNSVDNMVDCERIEDEQEKEQAKEANNRILLLNMKDAPSKCKFANHIIDDKVECGYGDYGQDIGAANFSGTPSNYQYFGFYSVPSGVQYYNDTNFLNYVPSRFAINYVVNFKEAKESLNKLNKKANLEKYAVIDVDDDILSLIDEKTYSVDKIASELDKLDFNKISYPVVMVDGNDFIVLSGEETLSILKNLGYKSKAILLEQYNNKA